MGKKEASKGREWEKGRRDILNQTFDELYKALPSYVEGRTISKKTILTQALACIHQLQKGGKNDVVQENEKLDAATIQKWVLHILHKFSELVSFLHVSNLEVPEDFLSLESPPFSVSPDIAELVTKIGKPLSENCSQAHKNDISKKQKTGTKLKCDLESDSVLPSGNSFDCTSSKRPLLINGGKVVQCPDLKSEFSSSIAGTGIVHSNPLVVQSTPVQTQLVFTSGSSNTPLSASLPFLVSVTGVKTVNPFILVQSNVMAPTPLSTQKIVSNRSNTRPIQPGPPNITSKKIKKMPIPSLKAKSIFGNSSSHTINEKSTSSNGITSKSSKNIIHEKSSKAKQLCKSAPTKLSVASKFSAPMKITEPDNSTPRKEIVPSVSNENQEAILDVNKENVAEIGNNFKHAVEGNQIESFSSSSEEKCVIIQHNSCAESPKEAIMEIQSELSGVDQQLPSDGKAAKKCKPQKSTVLEKKRLCEVDVNTNNVKRSKCDDANHNEKSSEVTTNNISAPDEESSPTKLSKSNYSISALCARQQLLQSGGDTSQALGESSMQHSLQPVKDSELHNHKQVISKDTENTPEQTSGNKSNDHFCNLEKTKEVSLPVTYNGWSEKSKCKLDRACSSYNIFSSLPLHHSKNTFIPINDMDNFKAVPEPFDSSDTSFGLPLHTSDISNDLFASLQVPTGGHHSESISPTAAFLLAFPLVSTSKASELLSDEAVCENNDSQPGMKTILQIGNLDCDTPVTKCVSVFSSIEQNSIVDTASNVFGHDTSSNGPVKTKTLNSTINVGNFMPKLSVDNDAQKCSEPLLPLKEGSNFEKNTVTSMASKDNQAFTSKMVYQTPCSNGSKQTCQARIQSESTSVATVPNLADTQLDSSGLQVESLPGNVLNKTVLKSNSSQQTAQFLTCEKQTDWLEIPQTAQVTYLDFPTSSASRSDCAVNYVLPPMLMTSSISGEELLPVPKSQQTSSILSWATDNIQVPKPASKLPNAQEIFPPSKASNKPIEMHHLIPNHMMTSSQSQLVVGSSSAIGNKFNLSVTNYDQAQNAVNSSDQGLLLSRKQGASSSNFIPSGSNNGGKKQFPVKQVECDSTEAMKVPSHSCGNAPYTHQQADLNHETGARSSNITYSSSEIKQGKENNFFSDIRTSSQNIKSGVNSSNDNLASKQSVNQLNYDHIAVIPEGKQTTIMSDYSPISSLNVKGTTSNNHLMGNTYHVHPNDPSKQNVSFHGQFTMEGTDLSGSKKNMPHFNQNSAQHTKQIPPGINFNLETTSNVMQFGGSTNSSTSGHQELYNNKPNSHEGVKSQSVHHRQQCSRSDNKDPIPNLHRPPVNWMTAPDIRSHQHHTGPSFGNSSNSTQGLFYISDHTKESENASSGFDHSTNFHCLDISHASQPFYKGNEIHLFGNENLETFPESSAWSPNKNGNSSMLGNMMIPSTLPTLVGDLALGDTNISRPFLPPYTNDPPCSKKSVKRALNTSRRATDKPVEDSNAVSGQGQECVASFLSVSQLVNSGTGSKSRIGSSAKDSNISYSASFNSNDTAVCHSAKQNSSKSVSSNYSTEALLASTNVQQITHYNHRKRRSHGTHLSSSYAGTGVLYENSDSVSLQNQGSQTQFLVDLPRGNDYQGTFLPTESMPSFMLSNPPRSHRNHSYPLPNNSDRPSAEDNETTQKTHQPASGSETSSGRIRGGNASSAGNLQSSSSGPPSTVASTSNLMDFGYMNMPSTILQDDINYANHPHPSFLPHHSYPMPATQDSLYTTPRLSMHPPQNSNIQSPSATTLTNFHLSTIFPEINEKVIC